LKTGRNEEVSNYDTALICMSGHVVNWNSRFDPDWNTPFCRKCGSPTITKCQECQTDIRGQYRGANAARVAGIITPPAFCHNCGSAYPWTQSAITAATELAHGLEGFTQIEKEDLSKAIDDLVRQTPNAPLAAERFRKFMEKAGRETALAFRGILYGVIARILSRQIWGD
jgi:hypothetical protein